MALLPGFDVGPVREDVQEARRFEEQPLEFHKKIRDGYLTIARENPERWRIIDASLTQEEISQEIWRHIIEQLEVSRGLWSKVQPLL